ncbi:MAG: YfcC family protein [Acidobacteriota bacterium]
MSRSSDPSPADAPSPDLESSHGAPPQATRRVPHVYVLIALLTVLTALASLVVPSGAYERDADGRVIDGSFTYDDQANGERVERPRGWELVFAVLQAPLRGIDEAASIIAFILVLGGTFKVIERTGAFEAAVRSAIGGLGGARALVIPVSMLLFAVGGAIFGMSEEIIPFVLLLVPVVRALGYPPIVAVAVPLIGSQVGFAGAMINPFTIGIAQGIAGLPPLSGWQYRTGVWIVVTAIGIAYVTLRIRRLHGAGEDDALLDAALHEVEGTQHGLTTEQKLVLGSLGVGIAIILWGVQRFAWYVTEIGAIFLAVGVVAGIVGRLGGDRTAEAFVAGARELVGAAMVVGLARGIVVLAEQLGILDTVLYGAAGGLANFAPAVALNLMFVFQTALNFFVPSGSGQAALTMPIMAPLAELVGLTRQMAVLAFQLGDGFSNMIIPTSAVLMGSLEAAKVRYERWFAFAWPLQLILLAVGVAALTLAVAIGYGP